jgi:hypothetical protein
VHPSWNAVVKEATDGLVTQGVVALGGAVYAIPVLFLYPSHPAMAWIYLALSAIIYCRYFEALAIADGISDPGLNYPIGCRPG